MNIRRFVIPIAAVSIAIIPIWVATYPPMVDLPQHAAQVRALDELLKGQSQFSDVLEINAFVPYITAYAIALLLSQFVTFVTSIKIVLCLAVAGLPIATAFLLRQLNANTSWAWLTIPTAYGFAMNWGQINFVLGVPVGLTLLGAAVRYSKEPTLRRALIVLALTHLLFFTHILLLFFFGALAGLFVLINGRSVLASLKSLWPLLALAPVGLSWGLPIIGTDENNWHTLTRWEIGWHRVTMLPELMLGVPTTVGSAIVTVLLFAFPLMGGARFSTQPQRHVPLAFAIVVVMLAPNSLVGDFFIYQRFFLVLLPLYLFALDWRSSENARAKQLAAIGIAVLVTAWIANIANRYADYDVESRDFRAVMRSMESRKKVLSLIFARDSEFSTSPVYLHYPAWYQAENGGLVDFSFAGFYGQVVRYKLGKSAPADGDFVWMPWTLNWAHHKVATYDYIVVRIPDVTSEGPVRTPDCATSPLAHSGRWWLYKVSFPPPSSC